MSLFDTIRIDDPVILCGSGHVVASGWRTTDLGGDRLAYVCEGRLLCLEATGRTWGPDSALLYGSALERTRLGEIAAAVPHTGAVAAEAICPQCATSDIYSKRTKERHIAQCRLATVLRFAAGVLDRADTVTEDPAAALARVLKEGPDRLVVRAWNG